MPQIGALCLPPYIKQKRVRSQVSVIKQNVNEAAQNAPKNVQIGISDPPISSFKADFNTHNIILESIISLITAVIAKQGDFMQGGPVALMQYVLFPFQMNVTLCGGQREANTHT